MPVVSAWHSSGVGILLLMATRAIQSRYTFAFRTPDDVRKVTVAIISLLGIVGGGVTIDAARKSQHRIDSLPLGQSGCLRRIGCSRGVSDAPGCSCRRIDG